MAGWAIPGIELRVVDLDMKDVPRDGSSIGEVITRGDHVMSGYYREPEATAAAMAGGWFHTGDMAVMDRHGYIQIVDRKKEIIVSGGENISSIEVERAIFAHPDVFECAVVPAPDAKWGEVPAAIVVRKPGSSLTADSCCSSLKGDSEDSRCHASSSSTTTRCRRQVQVRSGSWFCVSGSGRDEPDGWANELVHHSRCSRQLSATC